MTLRRNVEKARAWQRRSRRIKPVSDKRAANASERIRVRAAVFTRDGWTCRLSHLGSCYGPLSFHHILRASQGGEYTLENGATLCTSHNDLIESDADVAAVAEELGLVRHWWEGRL